MIDVGQAFTRYEGESQSEARMVTFDQSEAWKLSKKTDVDDADRGDA